MKRAVGFIVCFLTSWYACAQDDIPSLTNEDVPRSDIQSPAISEEAPQVDAPAAVPKDRPDEGSWVERADQIKPDPQIGQNVIDAANSILDGGSGTGSVSDADEIPPFSFGKAVMNMVVGLGIVLALILALYYLTRKFGKRVPIFAGSQLGEVMGQIHITRESSLHFVRTGGRVLLVGVNPNSMSLIAEFDASTFDSLETAAPSAKGLFNPDSFLAHLKAKSAELSSAKSDEQLMPEDDDITALRGDIHRLQEYLREESRGSGETNS